jgi:hypothetical protein
MDWATPWHGPFDGLRTTPSPLPDLPPFNVTTFGEAPLA